MSDDIPVFNRAFLRNALDRAFANPELADNGLNLEVHIGRRQAIERFGSAVANPKFKWPVEWMGQNVYLIDADSHFELVVKGSYKRMLKACKESKKTK